MRADWEERKRQRPALGGERPPFLPSGLVLLSRCGACACVYVCAFFFEKKFVEGVSDIQTERVWGGCDGLWNESEY